MAPRRGAQQLVAVVALPLPAGRVPVRAAGVGQRRAHGRRPGVRADRHRRLRRRPLLGGRRRLRQGRRRRPPDAHPGAQRRTRGGHAARAAPPLVPQHVGLGQAGPGPEAVDAPVVGRRRGRARPSRPAGGVDLRGRCPGRWWRRGGSGARVAVLRQRQQRRPAVGSRCGGAHRPPQGRGQRPGGRRRRRHQPGPGGHQGGRLVHGDGRAGGVGGAEGPAHQGSGTGRRRPRPRLHRGDAPAPGGG